MPPRRVSAGRHRRLQRRVRKKQAFLEITPEDWQEVLQTNLTPAFYLARHAIPHMQAGAGDGWC